MSINNLNTYLNIKDSHLRVVSGNVYAQAMNIGGINVETAHGLQSVSDTGNVTSNTLQFSNAITSLTAASNVVVTGNVTAGSFLGDGSGLTGINLQLVTDTGNVTSNTVQFTNATTGIVATANVEVGGELTVSGNVSDLNVVSNVNMLHTANTASIKLNSNVVAEFPRSKKLIRYPRVALTAASGESSGYQGYYVTESSNAAYDLDRTSWKAFNMTFSNADADDTWTNDEGTNYNGTGNTYNGNINLGTGAVNGEWIKLQLPHKIRLEYMKIWLKDNDPTRIPENWKLYGSDDNLNWTELFSKTGQGAINENLYNVNANSVYNYLAVVVTKIAGQPNYFRIVELEYFGVPEYDPEAHGTDVTIKSYPNVPNTDWLEVYYDAKGLADNSTTVNDLKPVGTPNNGTVGGNTSVTDEAFTFDGSGDYITSTVTTGTGNQSFSVACWFKFTTLGGLLWGFTGTTNGVSPASPDNHSTPHAYFNTTGSITFDFWANSTVTAEKLIEANRWYAGVWTYDGNARKIYIDGTQVNVPQSSTPLSIVDNTSRLSIGIYPTNLSGGPMTGSVANFRLFNRALTSDEIYQLYAYQKEDFGHSTNNMTLKAGRLGIGTSEPRAALDVRGFIISNPIAFSAYRTSPLAGGDQSTTGVYAANTTYYNYGDCYDTSTYRFTAPVNGVYHFNWFAFTNTGASSTSRIFLRKNGDIAHQKGNSIERHGNGLSADVYLDAGDYVTIEGSGSYPLYFHGSSNHNHYSGHLVYATQ